MYNYNYNMLYNIKANIKIVVGYYRFGNINYLKFSWSYRVVIDTVIRSWL